MYTHTFMCVYIVICVCMNMCEYICACACIRVCVPRRKVDLSMLASQGSPWEVLLQEGLLYLLGRSPSMQFLLVVPSPVFTGPIKCSDQKNIYPAALWGNVSTSCLAHLCKESSKALPVSQESGNTVWKSHSGYDAETQSLEETISGKSGNALQLQCISSGRMVTIRRREDT